MSIIYLPTTANCCRAQEWKLWRSDEEGGERESERERERERGGGGKARKENEKSGKAEKGAPMRR